MLGTYNMAAPFGTHGVLETTRFFSSNEDMGAKQVSYEG